MLEYYRESDPGRTQLILRRMEMMGRNLRKLRRKRTLLLARAAGGSDVRRMVLLAIGAKKYSYIHTSYPCM